MQKLVEQAGFKADIVSNELGTEELMEAIIDYYLTMSKGKR